jgi:predicted nucleic acid-binding protein
VTVFVDSGGWLATLIAADQHHAIAAPYFQALLDAEARIVTSDYVLDETVTRLRYDVGHARAVEFLALIRAAVSAGALRVHRITADVWNAAEAIFLKYADARLSFTDCTSFALLRHEPAEEVFGFDHHFEMMGQVLQPKP